MTLKDFESRISKTFDLVKKVRYIYQFDNHFGLSLDFYKDDLSDMECVTGYWKSNKWYKETERLPIENVVFVEDECEAAKLLKEIEALPDAFKYYELLSHIDGEDSATTTRTNKQAVLERLHGNSENYNTILQTIIDRHQEEIDRLKAIMKAKN
jgi:hypothetical protein